MQQRRKPGNRRKKLRFPVISRRDRKSKLVKVKVKKPVSLTIEHLPD